MNISKKILDNDIMKLKIPLTYRLPLNQLLYSIFEVIFAIQSWKNY
jgi:hypothetical protein